MRISKRAFNRMQSFLCISACLILVSGLSLFCSAYHPAHAQPLSGRTVVLTGVTKPLHDIILSPEVPGTVVSLNVSEGEQVHKGQLLLQLNHDLEDLEVKRRKMIWKGKAKLKASQVQESILKALFESTEHLYTQTNAVSREELEKQKLEYKRMHGQVQQLLLTEQREKIEYEIAKARLAQKYIHAPLSGTVIKTYVKQGERCRPEKPALRLVSVVKCLFVCNIDEKYTHLLRQGQKLPLQIQSGSKWLDKTGTLQVVKPVADPASGLVEILVRFSNQDRRIHPGMPGRLTLSLQDAAV